MQVKAAHKTIIQLRLQGLTYEDIGNKTGYSLGGIYYILDKYGIDMIDCRQRPADINHQYFSTINDKNRPILNILKQASLYIRWPNRLEVRTKDKCKLVQLNEALDAQYKIGLNLNWYRIIINSQQIIEDLERLGVIHVY